MSSFGKSLSAFKSAVAADNGVSASSLNITPSSEKVTAHGAYQVPGFVAFIALIPDKKGVTGWADEKGTVVTLQRKNFGPILEAMGFADPESPFPALEQARRIAWAHVGYGFVATLVDFKGLPKPADAGPPALAHDADGSATLTFFMIESGDTGFMAAVRCVVKRDAQGTYTYSLARA